MNRKLVFALSLFVLLCSSLYVRFNSVEVKSSNGYPVAPDFTLTDIDGNDFSLSGYLAKVVLLEFFRTSCPFCINQTSHLKSLNEKFGEKLVIVSISPENETTLRNFREDYTINWTITKDTANVFSTYNVSLTPTLVLIDQDGYIHYRHEGLTEESQLRPEIESLLPKTIYVDDGNVSGPWNGTKEHPYQNITSGLEHASDNDIVFVQNGTYYEHVTINKSISLIGENKYTTIIDGNSAGTVVNITASNVKITNFIIRKSRSAYPDCGICLSSDGNNISYNFITDNYLGIWLEHSSNNTISGNNITENSACGIWLHSSSSNTISANNITNNSDGINLEGSSNNNMTENKIIANNGYELPAPWPNYGYSIKLYDSSNNFLRDNALAGNDLNFGVLGSALSYFVNDVDVSNLVDGKPMYYWVNAWDAEIPLDAGYVVLVNCTNVNVENLTLTRNMQGILLAYTTHSTISENSVTNNLNGIMLFNSSSNVIRGNDLKAHYGFGIGLTICSNNTISKNNVTATDYFGIYLSKSPNNALSGNNITNNTYGILLGDSLNNSISGNNMANNFGGIVLSQFSNANTISGNSIKDNSYGIRLYDSSNNSIYRNNFLNNFLNQTTTDSSMNFWDNGFEGNYWSNYNGTDTDHDGIGDTWYAIGQNNTDHFPLMGEFHKYHIWYIEPGFTLTLISNSTISNFAVWFWIEHPEYRGIYFNVAGETGYGFCRLCIPKNLMAPPYTVTIDNGQTPVTYYNETLFDNSTHRWIYFAYLHSEHQVEIIAEFPSFLILPLFMIATLLTVIVYEKRAKSDRYPREK